ncbi:MAG: hypothetical protein Q7J54_06300 [Candidatus Woesearchaeota archaeon]|nr:hypothetical protein [Candidatus Woesearchaeota archaeon]
MLRVIFDTNIYGLLIKEKEIAIIREKIEKDQAFIVYGFQPIRKELRDTPKSEKLGKLKKRNLLLSLYDEITKGRYLKDSIQINRLALKFYNAYRKFGGIRSWKETNIDVDFTIVACASFYKLDVVVSDDSTTMLSKPAMKAYRHITLKEGSWHPNFWKYSDLRVKYEF